jgi:small subunit ribosomal protein S21
MIEIYVGESERIEDALKKFRRKIQRSGLLKELRRRRAYLKPSAERKQKQAAARRRGRKRKFESE